MNTDAVRAMVAALAGRRICIAHSLKDAKLIVNALNAMEATK